MNKITCRRARNTLNPWKEIKWVTLLIMPFLCASSYAAIIDLATRTVQIEASDLPGDPSIAISPRRDCTPYENSSWSNGLVMGATPGFIAPTTFSHGIHVPGLSETTSHPEILRITRQYLPGHVLAFSPTGNYPDDDYIYHNTTSVNLSYLVWLDERESYCATLLFTESVPHFSFASLNPDHGCNAEPASVDFGVVGVGQKTNRTNEIRADGLLTMRCDKEATVTYRLGDELGQMWDPGSGTRVQFSNGSATSGPVVCRAGEPCSLPYTAIMTVQPDKPGHYEWGTTVLISIE